MLALAATAIDMLAKQVTVRRYAPSTRVNGILVKGAVGNITLAGVILEPKGEDYEALPDGVERRGMKSFWTRADVKFHDVVTGGVQEPDEVLFGGKTYSVYAVMRRDEAGFNKALLRLKDDSGRAI